MCNLLSGSGQYSEKGNYFGDERSERYINLHEIIRKDHEQKQFQLP